MLPQPTKPPQQLPPLGTSLIGSSRRINPPPWHPDALKKGHWTFFSYAWQHKKAQPFVSKRVEPMKLIRT